MIYAFKSTKIFYLTFLIVGDITIAATVVVNDILRASDDTSIFLLFRIVFYLLIYSIACMAVFGVISQFMIVRTSNILFVECNPQKYIVVLTNILKRLSYIRKNKWVSFAIICDLATGYAMLGDFEASIKTLDTLDISSPKKRTLAIVDVMRWNSYANAYFYLKDYESSKIAIDNMKSALENPKLTKYFKDHMYYHCIEGIFDLNVAAGQYTGAEEFWRLEFARFTKLLNKVEVMYKLGELYYNQGKYNEAKEALDYVIQNSGSTFYSTYSKQLLEKMQL